MKLRVLARKILLRMLVQALWWLGARLLPRWLPKVLEHHKPYATLLDNVEHAAAAEVITVSTTVVQVKDVVACLTGSAYLNLVHRLTVAPGKVLARTGTAKVATVVRVPARQRQ